jgi:hypothetical protein
MDIIPSSSDDITEECSANTYVSKDKLVNDLSKRIHEELNVRISTLKSNSSATEATIVKHIFASPLDKVTSHLNASHSNYETIENIPGTKRKKSISQQVEYPGDLEKLRLMLDNSDEYDRSGKDMFGVSAIHKFAAWNKSDLLQMLMRDMTENEVNALGGENNFSCLHYSIEMNALQTLEYLVSDNRVSLVQLDKFGRTAMQYATELNNVEAMHKLSERKK